MRLVSASFCEEIEQVRLSSLGTARGRAVVVEQMDWTREPQPVGQMNAVLTLVADGVQVGERQRAKNLSPNLQKR